MTPDPEMIAKWEAEARAVVEFKTMSSAYEESKRILALIEHTRRLEQILAAAIKPSA